MKKNSKTNNKETFNKENIKEKIFKKENIFTQENKNRKGKI